jgi:hypothetical protein
MKRILRDYSFGWLMLGLFLLSWIGQFFSQMAEFANEAQEHGQAFEWSQFMPAFLASTWENWQSEFLQLLFQAAGLKWLMFKGSSQSPDGDDRIEAKLNRLLEEQGIDPKTVSAAYLAPKTVASSSGFKGDG